MHIPIALGKAITKVSQTFNLGSGSTWPGEIALSLDANFLNNISKKNPHLKIVLVAGTNGKTTTTKLTQEVLERQNYRVFRNEAGANLINGIASSFVYRADIFGKISYDVALFEIDENSLPRILEHITPFAIILLNLFRDQLDRYGEVNTIAEKWQEALKKLPKETLLVTNGDDPMLRFIGEKSNLHVSYFGIDEKLMDKKNAPHDVDFLYCPKCKTKLEFIKRSYSHMGIYKCPKCGFRHAKTSTFNSLPNPMFGLYNKYNINAASLLLQNGFGVNLKTIELGITNFDPAFGRQERIIYKGKNIFLLLSKNPASFNQSIQAIIEQDKNPNVLLLLNDRIPDGRDVSWIWDVEFEELKNAYYVTISGDRAYDMGVRIKYCDIPDSKFQIHDILTEAIIVAASRLETDQTLYILATYSAMLDVRKILKGRKIL